jgi:hypothetical protein
MTCARSGLDETPQPPFSLQARRHGGPIVVFSGPRCRPRSFTPSSCSAHAHNPDNGNVGIGFATNARTHARHRQSRKSEPPSYRVPLLGGFLSRARGFSCNRHGAYLAP